MRLTIPNIHDLETRQLGVAPPISRRTDRLTPPASPAPSFVASVETDHQSVVTSDSFLQQYQSDQQSIISADTFVSQLQSSATEQAITTDWDSSTNERRQPQSENSPNRDNMQQRHDEENLMTMGNRVIIDDNSVTAPGANVIGNLGPGSSPHIHQNNISVAPPIDTPQGSEYSRVGHSSYKSESDPMEDLLQKINEVKISWENHHTPSNRRNDDVDQDPSNFAESSHTVVSNGSIPYPRIGFRDDNTIDIVSPTMENDSMDSNFTQKQTSLSDDKIPTMVRTTTSSPNSEIFPMDSVSRASSISQRGDLVPSNDEPLATDFEHMSLINSNSSGVRQPLESITLEPQLDNTTINKPDQNDGFTTTASTATQKPDDISTSMVPKAATKTSKAHTNSVRSSYADRRGSFMNGDWGPPKSPTKSPKKDTSGKRIAVQQAPPSSHVQGSSSHFLPFSKLFSGGKAKGKAKQDPKQGSKRESKILQPTIHQLESDHATEQVENQLTSQPKDQTIEPKNRDSISDDEALPSDTDDRIIASSAHRPSASFDTSVGSSSVHESSSIHPIPIMSQHSSRTDNISANVTHSEGILSTSPASYPSSSRAQSFPPSTTLTSFQSPAIDPTAQPLIQRLQRHAHTSLECVRFMDFSRLISYAHSLFAGMRQLESEGDYEEAYVQGYMGIM